MSGQAQGGVVLNVDDKPVARTLCDMALRDAGYQVVSVESGAEALAALERDHVDALLTDIHMPGMGGVELLEEARRRRPDLPVILITGSPDIESAVRAIEHGAFRYLHKPLDLAELVETVHKAVQLTRFAALRREASHLLDGGTEAPPLGDLRASFEASLERLWIAFQPIVPCVGGGLYGWEVLLRSDEPSLADPGSILDAAERLGEVDTVGRAVRAQAAAAFERLPSDTALLVNMHPRDLRDPELYEASSPLSAVAERVVLEITERAALDDVPGLEARVSALRGLGYRIALDDLGAGFASLSSFARLAPELVKVDMSLVRGVQLCSTKARILGSLATLCSDMGVVLIAEGVETPQERDKVVQLGCHYMQGYLLGRPAREPRQPDGRTGTASARASRSRRGTEPGGGKTSVPRSSATPPRPGLTVIQGPDLGRAVILAVDRSNVLGREPGIELELHDGTVSRRHVRLDVEELRPSGWAAVVTDLESRNGTWINGQRVTWPMPLEPGDKLQLGDVVLRYQLLDPLDLSCHQRMAEKVQLANVDPTTGLLTKHFYLYDLPELLTERSERLRAFSLLMVDVDGFKQVNDVHGHDVGDRALAAIGDVVRRAVRASDLAVRFGGDEVVVILPGADAPMARAIATRIREGVADLDLGGVHVSVSQGLATSSPGDALADVIRRADEALRVAKARGRGGIHAIQGTELASTQLARFDLVRSPV